MNLRAACVPLIVAVLATSCDQHLPFTPNIEIQRGNPSASARVGRTASSEGTRHVEGGAGPGALYALDVPENWNGDLVVYAHSLDFGKKAYGNLVELARLQREVAGAVGCPVGALVVHAKSAHVYEPELTLMAELSA